ncbi:hypothetical protein RhiJN_07322 [Ceratobasidium sp. AG-Ba]|nr:hypothetical protein RhiJN_07322 [Ceratobasidium sp. AG-Ba]QRW06774.1 hypothetical protein RhiLY_05773 [Ceratobasidium sp. AG-Ba]
MRSAHISTSIVRRVTTRQSTPANVAATLVAIRSLLPLIRQFGFASLAGPLSSFVYNARMWLYPRPNRTHPSCASGGAAGALFVARTRTLDRETHTLVLEIPKGAARLTKLPTADASRTPARRSPGLATVCSCGARPMSLERSQSPW